MKRRRKMMTKKKIMRGKVYQPSFGESYFTCISSKYCRVVFTSKYQETLKSKANLYVQIC